jgi:hypothetical protein
LRRISLSAIVAAGFMLAVIAVSQRAPAAAANPAEGAIRAQFSGEQWTKLRRLRHSAVMLPAWTPDGYKMVALEVERNLLQLGGEGYRVTYGDGKNAILWDVANVQAGGDAGPESLRVQYDSPLLGRSVLYIAHDIPHPVTGQRGDCWITGVEDQASVRGESYGLIACGPGIKPQMLVRFLESVQLLWNHAPPSINHIVPESLVKSKWVVWTLTRAGGGYRLDSVYYPDGDDVCSTLHGTFGGDGRDAAVRGYYDAWSDGRFDDAWRLLSPRYQRTYTKPRWIAEHHDVKEIGAIAMCGVGSDKVATQIFWVDK